MIIETKAYYDFYKSLPGGKYIHHSSNDYESEKLNKDYGSPESKIIIMRIM